MSVELYTLAGAFLEAGWAFGLVRGDDATFPSMGMSRVP
jgi:hypothetical protein